MERLLCTSRRLHSAVLCVCIGLSLCACNLSDPLADGRQSDGADTANGPTSPDSSSDDSSETSSLDTNMSVTDIPDTSNPSGSDASAGDTQSADDSSTADSAASSDADTAPDLDADTSTNDDADTSPIVDADTSPNRDADSGATGDTELADTAETGVFDANDADGSNATDSGADTDSETDASDTADSCSSSESCNGVDDDCDGVVDEGCPCTYDPTETDDIDTDGSHADGVCPNQTIDSNGVCNQPTNFESPENSCSDGLDNDCDGGKDANDADCGGGTPGAVCTSDADCNNGPCVSDGSTSVCAHTIFMTNNDFSGDIGGLSGLDQSCNNIASNAGFSGTWEAVASSSNDNAQSRISVAGPIYNTDGARVADDASDFWDGSLQNSLNFDETGTLFVGPSIPVWTGTTDTGSATGLDCNDWSSSSAGTSGTFGSARDTSNWADDGSTGCDSTFHLYCIDGQ